MQIVAVDLDLYTSEPCVSANLLQTKTLVCLVCFLNFLLVVVGCFCFRLFVFIFSGSPKQSVYYDNNDDTRIRNDNDATMAATTVTTTTIIIGVFSVIFYFLLVVVGCFCCCLFIFYLFGRPKHLVDNDSMTNKKTSKQ